MAKGPSITIIKAFLLSDSARTIRLINANGIPTTQCFFLYIRKYNSIIIEYAACIPKVLAFITSLVNLSDILMLDKRSILIKYEGP